MISYCLKYIYCMFVCKWTKKRQILSVILLTLKLQPRHTLSKAISLEYSYNLTTHSHTKISILLSSHTMWKMCALWSPFEVMQSGFDQCTISLTVIFHQRAWRVFVCILWSTQVSVCCKTPTTLSASSHSLACLCLKGGIFITSYLISRGTCTTHGRLTDILVLVEIFYYCMLPFKAKV